jgi:Amt family ammonium transporter
VLPGPALIIGIVAGDGCFWAATSLKPMFGYDDSLDTFGVHGIGGIIGALLTGVFAYGPLTATKDAPQGVNIGGLPQFEAQVIAVCATLVWSGVVTFVILKVVDATIGLRVSEEEEREGLDVVLHGERLG